MEGGNKGIPRVWSDSKGHKATITLFSEMADWQVNNFSNADTLWHKEEAGKGRKWMPKKKQRALMAMMNVGLKKLTVKQRRCFYLYYYQGKTLKDISIIFGISKKVAWATVQSGLKKMRKFLKVD